jgi:hypothetical protein
MSYNQSMKSLTVRIPDELVDRLEAEAKRRKMSKSDIVRERLSQAPDAPVKTDWSEVLTKVVGSVEGLPRDVSANTKAYLRATGYGRKRPR